MSIRGGNISRRGPRNIGQLGRRPTNAIKRAGARTAGSGAHAMARAGHYAGRAAGSAARAGARAAGSGAHAAGRATRPAANTARSLGGNAAHMGGRAARPGINATKNVGRNVANAARLAGNAARGPAGMAKPAANAAKNAINRLRGANSKPEKPKSAAAEARRKAVNKGLEGGKALGPYGMVAAKAIILVKDNKKVRELLLYGILFAAFLLVYFLAGGTSSSNPPKSAIINQPTNPLQVTVTCNPAQIPVGKTSVCTITVTDSQDTDDITVVATIYPFAQYKENSASPQGTYDSKSKTVTWDTQKLKIQLSAPITQTFTLTVTKTQKIDAVPIVATVNAAGGVGVAGSGCGSFNKNATDFNTLMTGQGRCTGAAGNDENSFVSTMIQNGGAKFGLNGKQSQLQAIYQAATAQNVNPVIIVTIWGVESTFGTADGENFNCANFHYPFAQSLSCAVDTLNHYMTYFEQQKTKPVVIPPNCSYNDAFLYAYEWYTPVCHTSDGNSSSRANFVLIYKGLMGI